jgi:transposase-like protein
MGQLQYSSEFKETAVRKLLSRGSRSVVSICQDLGVSSPTIYEWKRLYATSSGMKKPEKRPQDRGPAEKLKAVIEYESLAVEKRGEFLRREGLHSEHIEAWKKSMQAALEPGAKSQSERTELNELKARNKELERDLNRKDRALAETTALLVLKKKADLIWGTGENE